MTSKKILALDVGEKRIGVATADSRVPIAVTYGTVYVDGNEFATINRIIREQSAEIVVLGYPRNQSGEPTAQTVYVQEFAHHLAPYASTIIFQDESLTSVKAEDILQTRGQPYKKGDIDAMAATLILQDYLEVHHG